VLRIAAILLDDVPGQLAALNAVLHFCYYVPSISLFLVCDSREPYQIKNFIIAAMKMVWVTLLIQLWWL
jgi:hypothetical protein